MTDDQTVPDGFTALTGAGAFVDLVGPLQGAEGGVLGVRVQPRHLNVAGMAQGGFLATLVDVALGRAIRADADDGARVATVSLTTDYIRPVPPGAWLEAHTEVDRLGGGLAFADCSLRCDGKEAVRARAVFAVRADG
jgi:uncharacterized protein (TIGR00369 family)